MKDFTWSHAEKNIAKRAFEAAFTKECAAVMEHVKRQAAQAQNPADLWAIHDYLGDQRRKINAKYDYRYSRLILVFGALLREKWLDAKDIEGLAEEKLQAIQQIAAI